MMGMGLLDAREATYWEYTALVHSYNERHADPDKVDAPDEETFERSMAMISANPAMLN